MERLEAQADHERSHRVASGESEREMRGTDDALADILRFPDRSRPARPVVADVPLRTVVGEVLRDERHHQERTLADVATEAAVSLSYLSEIERGTKEVSSDLLAAIAGALDVTLVEVLEQCVGRLRGELRGSSGHPMLAA
jgi:hypothetical protein